jgi:hypothetical protein
VTLNFNLKYKIKIFKYFVFYDFCLWKSFFVANVNICISSLKTSLLTYQTDKQMVPRSASKKVHPRKSYFSSACEYVKLPCSLRVPKMVFFILSVSVLSQLKNR